MAEPRIALRPDPGTPELLDDVVVRDVSMFRAEMMGAGQLWICCYLAGTDQRIGFGVRARRGKLIFSLDEPPMSNDGITYEET